MAPETFRPAENGDHKCHACGTEVSVPHFFDTRGQAYCGPECWEEQTPGARERSRSPVEL